MNNINNMNNMKKILLTCAAVLVTVAMFAAKEVYDFRSIAPDANIAATTIGTDYVITSPANMGLISYGENNFGYRFAGDRDWGLRSHSDVRWQGLCAPYNDRYLAVLNLKEGDEITINYVCDANQTFVLYNSILSGISAGAELVSGTTYKVTTDGYQIFKTTYNGSGTRVYIRTVEIETAPAPKFFINYAQLAVDNLAYNTNANVTKNEGATFKVSNNNVYAFSVTNSSSVTFINENIVYASGDVMVRYNSVSNIGLFGNANNNRYVGIKDLKAGDIVKIAYRDNSGGSTALEGLQNMTESGDPQTYTFKFNYNQNRTLDYAVRRYVVTADGNVGFTLPGAYYIGYIEVLHAPYADGFGNVSALPSGEYAEGISCYAGGVTMTLGAGTWTRYNLDSHTDEKNATDNLFSNTAEIASSVESPQSITFASHYTGVIHLYCQYSNDLTFTDNADATNVQHSGWSNGESVWSKVAFTVEAGHTYTLSNTRASKRHRFAGFTFKKTDELKISEIAVGGGLTLVDGKTYDYDAAFDGRVTFRRSFASGNTYTICLPFDVPATEFERYFGNGVHVYDMVGCHDDELYFDEITESSTRAKIDYGYPYLITFGTNKTDGVKFFKDDSNDYKVAFANGTNARDRQLTDPVTGETFKVFKGALNPKTIASTNYILNAGNTIVQANSYTALSSFRGYFDLSFSSAISAGAPVRIHLGGNAATGIDAIDDIPVLNMNAPMYNIMGQQVDASYRGVVIQNGHKFMLQ